MGAPLTRSIGRRRDTRRSWAAVGAVVVAVLAGVLHLLGAEPAEVIGTLLFALVFAVALLGGRIAGFATAVVAAGVYAWLRRDALDEVGAARLGVVVAGRAASYLVLAYVADLVRDRLPRLPVLQVAFPKTGEHAAVAGPALEPRPGGGRRRSVDPRPDEAWGPPTGETPVWDPDMAPGGASGWDEPLNNGGGNGTAPDHLGPMAQPDEQWMPPDGDLARPSADSWVVPEAAPDMPLGWMQDDDYGDEIPVGYTGELFLQDLAGPDRDAGFTDDFGIGRDQPLTGDMPLGGAGLGQPEPPPPEPGGPAPLGMDLGGPVEQAPAPEPWGYEQPADPGDPYGYGPPTTEPPQPAYDQLGYDAYEQPAPGPRHQVPEVDPETRLWTARYFRDRLAAERENAHLTGSGFSVVMVQIADTPFRTLPHRRQVALLRELGHQFIQAQVVDHLVHLPDQGCHWFAVVLAGTDRTGAHAFERRLRSALAGYLRNRGLGLDDIQSATLTSPDDDETMSAIWASLLGEPDQDQAAWSSESRW